MGAKRWVDEKTKVALTVKEKEFCNYYIFGDSKYAGNASACYRKAFDCQSSPDNTIWQYASEIMKKPNIQEQIRQLSKSNLTDETITAGLEAIALNEQAKHADRARALELLGKIRGMFIDKSEVSVKTDLIFSDEEQK